MQAGEDDAPHRTRSGDSNVTKLIQPGAFTDQLTEILRTGARALLTEAVEAEVAEFLNQHVELKTGAAGRDVFTAIVESAVRWFRPITLTAAAAVLALIPLVREVFWAPMALAMMGGLIAATILTLTFLPALYALAFRVAVSGRRDAKSANDANSESEIKQALPAAA